MADFFLGAVPLILLFPLVGAATIALFGPYVQRSASAFIGCLSIGLSFLLTVGTSYVIFPLSPAQQALYTHSKFVGYWAHLPPDLIIGFRLLIDPLSLLWMLIITGVGLLIHVYSVSYMASDKNYRTFFAYMNLFVFTMLLLVMADNFLWLLVGWGGVGLASYLLIGFYYDRPVAVLAARKALIMNVIGDVGIMLAMFLMYAHVGSVSYQNVFGHVATIGTSALTWIGVWLLLGAVAKSAQLPLQTWLPDAMEGPTPVSALIHAATMVTAGVYLIARAHPIYDNAPAAAELVAIVGGVTALFAATIGCVQYDIKRVLAYSTMSQIGYMMLAVGAGAFAAGAFHFMTHAFFKALLFMSAGIVIHALGGEQDIRKMGGLATRLPFAYWTFLVGAVAIAGIFPFAGFFSKDAIIDAVLKLHHPYLFVFTVVAAGLTAFYMFRLVFLTFLTGAYRGDHEVHAETERTMTVPVAILAVLSLIGGWIVLPHHDELSFLLRSTFADAPFPQSMADFNGWLSFGVLLIALAGIAFAWVAYQWRPQIAAALHRSLGGVHALLTNAYYFDTIYHWLFEWPVLALAQWLRDAFEVDAVDALPALALRAGAYFGSLSNRWETGYLRRYGLTFVVGAALLLFIYLFVAHGATAGAAP
ncbi:MAG: NADH-quinone oxidoreductase subunit L [Candidatus Eremiobacteraeota bacterium]|nr:NADH-quinone oxidoreductase subunit L [Candidatus Eremiobacteraeota bacterium]